MAGTVLKVRNIVFYVLVVLFALIVASLGGRLVNVPFAVTAVLS